MSQTLDFLLNHGYSVLFFAVLVEQLGLPIPSIPILLAMGALAGRGQLSYVPALLSAVAACLIADTVWYWLGVYRGASILRFLCKISLEPDSCVRSTENMFLRHGPRALLFSKFVPGLSTASTPLAGMFRMKIWKFCLFDGLGSLIWAGFYSALGLVLRDQLESIAERAMGMGSGFLLVIVGAVSAWILWKYYARRRFYNELRSARITPEEVRALLAVDPQPTILDLRSALQWTEPGASKLPGALHMSFEELDLRLNEIPRERDVILYCT